MNQQPYQRASEEMIRQSKAPAKGLKTIAGVAGSVAAGGTVLGRVLPFLNQYIPDDLMQKGLSKIDPRLGKFVQNAKDLGHDANEIKDFIKSKMQPEKQEEPKKQSNPLQDFETNYPDIAQALANTMKQGQSPDAAAGILKTSSSFGKKVKELEKSVGKNFVDYVLELFGTQSGSMQQPQQMQQQQPQQKQGQQQGGNIDQELMAALDKILKM